MPGDQRGATNSPKTKVQGHMRRGVLVLRNQVPGVLRDCESRGMCLSLLTQMGSCGRDGRP
jgi:hypothetical protein